MMRRTGIIAAAAVLAVAGIAVPASAHARDDNATVCAATSTIVEDGLNQFAATMNDVSQRATKGDLAGADAGVKAAGANLVSLGATVHQEAARAEDTNLKTAVNDVGTELENIGTKLNSLIALQSVNITNLQTAANKLSSVCGVPVATPAPPPSVPGTSAPAPSTTSPAPSPTTSPTPRTT